MSTRTRTPSSPIHLQVIKLKNTYLTKTRKADEAEDESVIIFIYARFL